MTNLDATKIEFRLRMDPKRKAVKSHKENEAIQFDFDITADDFEEIASEMHKSGLILEEDSRAVAKLLKVQVHTLLKDRKERIAQAQAAAKEKELAKLQHALEQHHQMMYQQQQQQQQQHNIINDPNNQMMQQQQNSQQKNQQGTPIIANSQQNLTPLSQTPQQTLNQMQMQQNQQNMTSSKPPEIIQGSPMPNMSQQQPINQKLPIQQGQVNVPIANNNQQTPSPVVHDQIAKSIPQQQQMQSQQGDSGIGMGSQASGTSSTTSGTSIKKRRSNKSSERYPKLVVLSLNEEKIVECEMEVKPKTVTFKFDVYEVNPDEVAKDLVSYTITYYFLILCLTI